MNIVDHLHRQHPQIPSSSSSSSISFVSKHPFHDRKRYSSLKSSSSHYRMGYKPFKYTSNDLDHTTTTTTNPNTIMPVMVEVPMDNANSGNGSGNHHQEYQHQQDISHTLNNKLSSSVSLPPTTTTSASRKKSHNHNSYGNMNGIAVGNSKTFRSKLSNSYLMAADGSSSTTATNTANNGNIASGMNQVISSSSTSNNNSNTQLNQPQQQTASVNGVVSHGQHYMANISNSTASNLMVGNGKHQPTLLNQNLSMLESQTSPINVVNELNNNNNVGVGGGGVAGQTISSSVAPPKVNHHSVSDNDNRSMPFLCRGNLCRNGIGELLASLALMCILSLLMAFLALSFIQRSYSISLSTSNDIVPLQTISSYINSSSRHRTIGSSGQFNHRIVSNSKEYMKVFQISVSLSTLTIALDLCCLFVCCIQFLSIIKLLKTPFGARRSFEFIKKTSHIRVISIGAFLVSIPIFFTGVILYTFVNFDEIPALITSIIIGIGIIFCGVASVQNVYLWQWEKTKASQDMRLSFEQQHQQQQQNQLQHQQQFQLQQQMNSQANIQSSSFLAPSYGNNGQLTTSTTTNAIFPLELSTLV